jgi:1-acyl-sn-glycerol-3-phosphate acyltransferase
VRRAALALLRLLGWRVEFRWPPVPRCVIVVYPHTSNLDFFVGYLAKVALGLPAHFVGKASIFRWPVAGLLRRMGGIPVNRHEPQGFVDGLVAELERRPRMFLALAPEGTRTRVDHWKSGFYRLALRARIPVGLAYLDFGRKVVGLTTYLDLTGDEERDLARIRAEYQGVVGFNRGLEGEIRFRHDASP